MRNVHLYLAAPLKIVRAMVVFLLCKLNHSHVEPITQLRTQQISVGVYTNKYQLGHRTP